MLLSDLECGLLKFVDVKVGFDFGGVRWMFVCKKGRKKEK